MFEPNSALVDDVSGILVAANDKRRGLFIRNMSSNKIYLGFAAPAELNKGFILFPNESYSMTENDYCRCDICAISDVADSVVYFQEFSFDGRL